MDIGELEDHLAEFLPAGFSIETDPRGQLVIFTGLRASEEEEGELIDFESDETDEESIFDGDCEPLFLEDEDEL